MSARKDYDWRHDGTVDARASDASQRSSAASDQGDSSLSAHAVVGLSARRAALAAEYAERFHTTYERLAPSFGYTTRKASAVPWADVPAENRALMVAVCGEILGALTSELAASQQRAEACDEALTFALKERPAA